MREEVPDSDVSEGGNHRPNRKI